MSKRKRIPYKRIAWVLSLLALIAWSVLGTGASLAWFTDTTPQLKNVFNFADFDLLVEYRKPDGTYADMDGVTTVFDENALFEPGYTQVVHLRVTNNGDVPFDYRTAVILRSYVPGTNVFGQSFTLQDHLRFGMATGDEAAVDAAVATREDAAALATQRLNTYYYQPASLGAGQTVYMALVVYMPTDIGNDANYRGTPIPEVKLGISVTATQQH